MLKLVTFLIILGSITLQTQLSFSIESNYSKDSENNTTNTLAQFHPSRIIEQPPLDEDTGQVIKLPGSVLADDKFGSVIGIRNPQTGEIEVENIRLQPLIVEEGSITSSNLDVSSALGLSTLNSGVSNIIPNQVTPITINPVFKSCFIHPFSSSNVATYHMNGNGKISYVNQNKNYTIDKYMTIDINVDMFNRIKGSLNSHDLRVNINFDPIVTLCSSYKTFEDYQSSTIATSSFPINPPFDSCPSGFETSYTIAGRFNYIDAQKTIHIPYSDNIRVSIEIISDLQKGRLGNSHVSVDGLYEPFTINSISTKCRAHS